METALAEALQQAADAGHWDVVAKLAAELEARRLTLISVSEHAPDTTSMAKLRRVK